MNLRKRVAGQLAGWRKSGRRRNRNRNRRRSACCLESLERRLLLAATPLAPEFQVNDLNGTIEAQPVVARSLLGESLIVWSDGASRVLGRKFDAAGQPGAQFQLDDPSDDLNVESGAGAPDVAMDDAGNAFVVWEQASPRSSLTSEGVSSIVGRHVFRDGSLGPLIDLVVDDPDDLHVEGGSTPRIAMAGDGRFVVAFHQGQRVDENDRFAPAVLAQRFSKGGIAEGAEIILAEDEFEVSRHDGHDVGMADNGDFVAVWRRLDLPAGQTSDVVARRYSAAGSPLSQPFIVNSSRDPSSFDPAVAVAGDGAFVISWTSDDADEDDGGILARVYDANGADALGSGEFLVNDTTRRAQESSDIFIDRNGVAFTVVWHGYSLVTVPDPNPGDHRKIFLRQYRLDRDENAPEVILGVIPEGIEQVVNPSPGAGSGGVGSFFPAVAGSLCGGLTVAWQVNSPVQDVYARLYDAETFTNLARHDSDGDALPDCWEMHGYSVEIDGVEQFIDLPAMGANPNRKDIFVEVDYMDGQRPTDAAMKLVRNAFANAPVMNPDGSTGITLHIDHGEMSPMHPGDDGRWHSSDDVLWSDIGSRSDQLPVIPQLGADDARGNYIWDAFDAIKHGPDMLPGTLDDRLEAGRALAFHYAIFAHTVDADGETGGVARNEDDAAFFEGSGDFIVSLAGWNNGNGGTVLQEAGTFMHELGHNLGLAHGGGDQDNYKPNYLSVMNYSFATRGILVGPFTKVKFGTLDYSRWDLDDLNENDLDENKPISGPGFVRFNGDGNNYGTVFYAPNSFGDVISERKDLVQTLGTDWNGDQSGGSRHVRVNINNDYRRTNPNRDPIFSVLAGHNDWQNLVYNGGGIGGRNVGFNPPQTTLLDELTFEEASLLTQPFNVIVTGEKQRRDIAGAAAHLKFMVKNIGTDDDTYDLRIESLRGWGDSNSFPATVTIPTGQSAEVVVTINVPAGTDSNEFDEITLMATSQGNSNFLDVATTTVSLETRDGVSGQKWHDRNGDGVKNANEPGLNGWTIEVVDNDGQVIAETVTASIDLNSDGQIDPFSESGLYHIDVQPGSWMVREVPQYGWRQTYPATDSFAESAFNLDQQFDFRGTQNQFEDWGGLGEKWFYSKRERDWFYIVPDGGVFRWNGTERHELTGTKVAQLSAGYHQDISRIHAAAQTGGTPVEVVAGQTTPNVDFGNQRSGAIEGRSWDDVNADGVRNPGEPWLNGWTITLSDETDGVIATTVTGDRDLNNDQQIDPETETGWYVFEQLANGTFEISQEVRNGWSQTYPDRATAQTAFDADQTFEFRATGDDFRNWGGLNERWFWGRGGWHYITPAGGVFKWDNSPRTALTGTLVATLTSEYWEHLERLHDAVVPGSYRVRVTAARVAGIDFGNVRN